MAARAMAIVEELTGMATISAADARRILDAITTLDRTTTQSLSTLDRSVTGLDVKVANMGSQISALTVEVKDKASRSELAGVRSEFEKDLLRVEQGVDKDVKDFMGMYDSVVGEVREMRAKIDGMSSKLDRFTDMDERLKKLEPLSAEATNAKGFVSGARWAIGIVWTLLATGVGALLVKVFGGSTKP